MGGRPLLHAASRPRAVARDPARPGRSRPHPADRQADTADCPTPRYLRTLETAGEGANGLCSTPGSETAQCDPGAGRSAMPRFLRPAGLLLTETSADGFGADDSYSSPADPCAAADQAGLPGCTAGSAGPAFASTINRTTRPALAPTPAAAPPAGIARAPAPPSTPAAPATPLADTTGGDSAAPPSPDEDAGMEPDAASRPVDGSTPVGEAPPGDAAQEDSDGDTATGAAGAGGAGRGGSDGWLALAEADSTGGETDDALAGELLVLETMPIDPPPLQCRVLVATWPLPVELGAEDLTLPTSAPAGASAQRGRAGPGAGVPSSSNGSGGGGAGAQDQGAIPRPASDDPQQARARQQAAAAAARRAWQALAGAARREQQAFVERVNQTVQAMADSHDRSAAQVRPALDADLAAVDAAASAASTQIRQVAELALLQLDGASQSAALAISQAGRQAYGLIQAGAARATGDIAGVVTGLVAGHGAAYDGAITLARDACDGALQALNEWRDECASTPPLPGSDAMTGAKNESLQTRIPRWADAEATCLMDHAQAKETAWTSARKSSVINLSCSLSGSLESQNCQAAAQARDSVAQALKSARERLREQTRAGRQTLADLRRSTLRQVAGQRQAARSGLTSRTRATLGSLRGEAQGALRGVQGAAGSALAGYWRGADSLRPVLRNAAGQGPAALERSARQAPNGILAGLRRSSASLDTRLGGNRDQLLHGMAERVHTHQQAASTQREQAITALQQLGSDAGRHFDEAGSGFLDAFRGLAQTVSEAASAWARPTTTRMAAHIQAARAQAQQALDGLLNGQSGGHDTPPPPAPDSAGAGGGAAAGCAAAPCAPCADCTSANATDASGAGTGPAASTSSSATSTAGPQGLYAQVDEEVAAYTERLAPATFFDSQISGSNAQVEEGLRTRAVNVARKLEGGFAGTVDEIGVIAALRGLTPAKGLALDVSSYPKASGRGSLNSDLQSYLGADSDDYATAAAYLGGNAVEGARLELADSTGIFNDDEARIEEVMRALSPDQAAALGAAHPGAMDDIRDALGGTDLKVFNALAAGDHARADAYRLRDAVDEARRDGNADAVHSAIEQYTGAPGPGDWRAEAEVDAEANRAAVVQALGGIVGEVAGATTTDEHGRPLASDQLAVERAVAYVSRDIEVQVGGGGPEGGAPQTLTLRLQGANRDLAGALLRHGPDSVQARVARLGVEIQRSGDPPNPLAIDRAMFDARFTPDNPNATPQEREANERARAAARADRERVLLLAAQNYAGDSERLDASHDPAAVLGEGYRADPSKVGNARQALVDRLRSGFGSDTLGGDLAEGLLTDERPSPRTAALAMRHAQQGCGTNEELLFRFTERMTREEIADMRTEYAAQTHRSLDADLGTYGEGDTFTELSGDDRLRMERALRGVARTDQERLENAAFAITQQRNETGRFGWLAEGSLADQVMNNTEVQLQTLAGGPIRFNQHGELASTLANFSANGEYSGADRDHFRATTAVAQTVAENYSHRIDAYADVATTGIAVLGAIAAAAITVATAGAAGAAGPLIAAALVTGLASMSANYAIKGGRYGWEQAAIDLGMTAVQAITAGVGAQLGAAAQVASKGAAAASTASRSLVALSRLFTGNPVVDQIIVGAITGSIGGLGGAAFDERTWEHGAGDAVGALFGGLLRGALAGGATATLSQSVEALGRNGPAIAERARALAAQGGVLRTVVGTAGRGVGALGQGLDAALNASAGGGLGRTVSAVARRGLARGAISGLGAMGGRGMELAVDSATGRFKGDAGEALLQIGQAGLRAFLQGMGEGAGEAFGQARHTRTLQRLGNAIAAERASQGLPPLAPHDLEAAAGDLLFMNHVSEGDALRRAINLQHVADHGGLHPAPAAAATPHPDTPAEGLAGPHATRVEDGSLSPPQPAPVPDAQAHAATQSRPAPGGVEGDVSPRAATQDVEGGQVKPGTAHDPASAGDAPRHGGDAGDRTRQAGRGDGETGDRLFPNLRKGELDAAFDAAEGGPMVRVEGRQPDADTRPLRPAEAGEPSLLQRQRAGALHEEAQRTQALAEERLARAVDRDAQVDLATPHNPRRAARLREEANALLSEAAGLESRAGQLRTEAEQFASGRRSATADLPGPQDVDTMFARLAAEGPGLVQVPQSDVERNPALLPRLLRPMLEGESGGRLVFRVESDRSRKLVHVDARGHVTIEGGASAHLNFGSFERAVEFVLNHSEGQARIYAFEVDEAWVRSVRSAGMPEHGTGDLHGQPRVVDVRFADDQLEIPAPLIGELNRFIVPGSGKVHEIARPGAPSGGSGGGHGGGGGGSPGPSAGPGHAPATADEAHAARLLRGEGETDSPPPARAAGTDEAPAPARAGTADEAASPRSDAPHAEGTQASTTAAAVPGSNFHGEGWARVVIRGKNVVSATPEALQRLRGPGGQFEGLLRPGKKDPSKLLLSRHGGGELEVEVRVGAVSRSSGDGDGPLPVASYVKNGDRVAITVSDKASPAQVQRALAHELGELRFVSHERSDLLQPGVHQDTLPAASKGALSRHDRGRMAEVEHLAREIEAAHARGDEPGAAQLQDEAGRLVAHMGLVHGGEAADARRALALSALEPGSSSQRLLGDMVLAARANPMLEAPLGGLDDLSLLARQSAYQQGLRLNDQHQLRAAAARVVEEGFVRLGGRTVDAEAIAQVRERLPDEASRALLDRAVEHASRNGRDVERDLALAATARPDPLQQELARQRFGDHPNFQDFDDFKARYLKTHKSLDGRDAALQQRLFQVWAAGAFVTAQGGIRGIAVGAIRAVPTDIVTHGLSLVGDAAQVKRAADQARALDTMERTLQEMAGKGKASGRTPEQMAQDLYDARIAVRDLGEALGEHAAGHFAQQHLNIKTPPLPCSRRGAGVPDLAYRAADGRLILIEAKGPEAGLKFRRTADGRLAEQGTPQYLESLACDMMRSTSPADVQVLGHQILVALRTSPPNIDYYVVRQPLDSHQAPTALEAQRFDLGSGRTTSSATTGTTTMTNPAP